MRNTTLCYIERGQQYLMLHRVKKENDLNHDKWIGIGGKFEGNETPDECLLREAYEETGLTLTEMRTKASYAGWDFDTIWAIDTNKNGGLPYLRWQDDVPTVIEPTSLTLSAETVTLAAGRSTTLTAVFSPIGAGGKPTWSSDAPDVASVTAGGQVAAHRAGTAIITASYGKQAAP